MKKFFIVFAMIITIAMVSVPAQQNYGNSYGSSSTSTVVDNTKYILKLKLKQSHITLDLGTHAKDAMNSIEFELPVDKDFYNSVKIGDQIIDRFRVGSAVLYGSFGSWKMTVIGKRIQQ